VGAAGLRAAAAGAALAGIALGCGALPRPPAPERSYAAEIRRTAHGVPHVKAGDYGSLGFGAAWAGAEDNVCLMAELYLTVAAERSRFLGLGAGNLESDFFYRWLIDRREAEEPGLSPENLEFLRGAAAGYSQYLRQTGVERLSDPACRGAPWVREIGEIDVRRLQRTSQFAAALLAPIVAAAPPEPGGEAGLGDRSASPKGAQRGEAERRSGESAAALAGAQAGADLGSNAIALGSEATASGRGMFLGNPHQPWHGSFRFTMKHLTIPGRLDMIGASPVGLANAGVGHTEWLAWNGTVSTARRLHFYRLTLVPGRPTAYLYDGEPREMSAREVVVAVRTGDGRIEERRHTFYATHFGPLVEMDREPYGWTAQTAWALRQVDSGWRGSDEILEIQRARSVREAKAILDRHQGWPVNFLAADAGGEVLYADPGPVAHVTDAQLEECSVPGGLDGSRSACQWGSDPDAAAPGIFGPARLPHLFRRDWVANSNSSYWLTNPAQPLEGYARVLGDERTERSLRTRIGIHMVQDRLAGRDGGAGRRFTLEQLQQLMFRNRDYAGELLRDELVALGRERGSVRLEDGVRVDLREACQALAAWDLHDDLESRGAHLFREFMLEGGARYRVPFDPARALDTPRGLDRDDPRVLQALGRAVRKLREAGLALDAPLGSVQYVRRAGEAIPIHGGPGLWVFNAIHAPFRGPEGYPEVQAGTSFVMAVEFTERGPVSRALVTYSQSLDPTSPYYADQTRLFSRKQWVALPFREEEILADPELRTTRVGGPRPPG
jgi:acyl-homoserine-lactone acylase